MRRATLLLGVAWVAAVLGAAPAHPPDFNGRWTLNSAKSTFGKIPGGQPKSRTDLIVHRGPRIQQTLFLQTTSLDTTVYQYVTDSSKVVNEVDGRDITTRVWWQGTTLRLESKTKLLIFDMTLSERWTLSGDGRTLTNTRHVTWPGGKGDQTLVFDKAPR